MKRWLIGFLLGATILSFSGCNLFGWTQQPTSASDYLNEGRQKLRDGDYSGALNDFRSAVNEDPNNSEARYAYAKARLLVSGITSFDILTSLSQFSFNSGDSIPFFRTTDDYWPNLRATELLATLNEVNEMLAPIFAGQTSGHIQQRDVNLDFGLSRLVFGLTRLRDTNLDNVIASNESQVSMVWSGTSFDLRGVERVCQTNGSRALDSLMGNVSLFCGDLRNIIRDIVSEYQEPGEAGFDSQGLDSVASAIRNTIDRYRIADATDNNNNGYLDEMILASTETSDPTFYLSAFMFRFSGTRIDSTFITVPMDGIDFAGSAWDSPRPWTQAWVDSLRNVTDGSGMTYLRALGYTGAR
ncbi:MAG: hypothetical protein OEM52_04960 [bacterium]|nr:hypothetical protein [bacterium]